MESAIAKGARIAPYFLPQSLDFRQLPEPLQAALIAIVEPTYIELVIGAPNSLERSAGVSIAYLLTEEVLQQFRLGQTMDFSANGCSQPGDPERQRQIDSLLRLVGAKYRFSSFLARIQSIRANDPEGPGPHLPR